MTDPLDPDVLAEGERRWRQWGVGGYNRHAWEQWTLVHGEALLAVARDHARLTAASELVWYCDHCGPNRKSDSGWCASGCGRDHGGMSRFRLVPTDTEGEP